MSNERDRRLDQRRDAHAQEAAAWFAKWQSGSVDEEAFTRWRDADPAHALAFARVASVWQDLAEQPEDESAPLLTRRRVMRGGMAGAILAAAGSGLLATRAYAWNSASTGVGETRKLRLPDNSMVALNTDTQLSWRFSDARREFWLERGEVALDLLPGPVAQLGSDRNQARLAAGRFNARLRGDRLELMVLRGSATSSPEAVGDAAPATAARAYQRLSFAGSAPAVTPVSSEAAEAALAWQSGDIVFLDTPLADAAAEYNRYLLRKIVIDDPAVGSIRVGGRFTSSEPSAFLKAVSAGLGVRVRTTDTGYHLSS